MNVSNLFLQISAASSNLWQLLSVPVGELGVGGILGYLLGYGLKKIIRIVAYVTAAITALNLAFLGWLQSQGVITVTVNYDRLSSLGEGFVAWGSAQLGSLAAFASSITIFGAGFAGGILLGFSRG